MNPYTQVEHDASCWRRHAGEFYENRTTILKLRAEVERLQAELRRAPDPTTLDWP